MGSVQQRRLQGETQSKRCHCCVNTFTARGFDTQIRLETVKTTTIKKRNTTRITVAAALTSRSSPPTPSLPLSPCDFHGKSRHIPAQYESFIGNNSEKALYLKSGSKQYFTFTLYRILIPLHPTLLPQLSPSLHHSTLKSRGLRDVKFQQLHYCGNCTRQTAASSCFLW